MPQKAGKRTVRKLARVLQALELRKTGATYVEIGKALTPPCSGPNAHKLVMSGLGWLRDGIGEAGEDVRSLMLARLDSMLLQLWANRKNPRVADTILRVETRRAEILGIDAPRKIAETDPAGNALPPERGLDLSKLTLQDLIALEAIMSKARRDEETAPA